VLFLISKAWLGSPWCKNELNLIQEGLAVGDLPADVTSK